IVALAVVSLCAATITGALGYGYSSISVPIALLLISKRVLNPALVMVESSVNGYAVLLNRRAIRAILPRVTFMIVGIVPGVLLGSWVLSRLPGDTVQTVCLGTTLPLVMT